METSTKRTDLEILAHNLLWLRKRRGCTQRTMAKLLGIGVVTLRRLEHGELSPRLGVDFLFEIHRHFGIYPSSMLSNWME